MSGPHLSQTDLVGLIFKWGEKRGMKMLNSRQMNVVIKAADMILDEWNNPHREAIPNSGLTNWLASDDTGMSSMFMAMALTGGHLPDNRHPYDAGDFGRCVRMLEAIPEIKPSMDQMANHGPIWAALVSVWGELEDLYRTGLFTQVTEDIRQIISEAKP